MANVDKPSWVFLILSFTSADISHLVANLVDRTLASLRVFACSRVALQQAALLFPCTNLRMEKHSVEYFALIMNTTVSQTSKLRVWKRKIKILLVFWIQHPKTQQQ